MDDIIEATIKYVKCSDILMNKLSYKCINTLSIDLDDIIIQAYKDIWVNKLKINNPDIPKFNYQSLYQENVTTFIHEITDKIKQISLYINPKILILSVSGRVPIYRIQYNRICNYRDINNVNDIDCNMFVPGSDIAQLIDTHIKRFIPRCQLSTDCNTLYTGNVSLPPKVIYNHYNMAGESKVKILKILSELDDINNGYNIICGNGNDLLCMSLNSTVDNIILSTNSDFNKLVNIDILKSELNKYNINHQDYADILTFVANDYIPQHPSLRNIKLHFNDVFDAYLNAKQVINYNTPKILSNDNGLIYSNVLVFFNKLSEIEEMCFNRLLFLNKTFKNQSNILNTSKEKIVNDKGHLVHAVRYELYRKQWYFKALSPKGDIKILNTMLNKDYIINYSESDINNMSHCYLYMLNWFHHYYNNNDNIINWELYYPYHYAPLLKDIKEYLSITQDILHTNHILSNDLTKNSYNIIHQLISTLPIRSCKLAPKNIHSILCELGTLSSLYIKNFIIDRDGVDDDKSIILIPFINIKHILLATNNMIDLGYWIETNDPIKYTFTYKTKVAYPKSKINGSIFLDN